MRGLGSLLFLVGLVLAFAVGAVSRVTLDRSPQPADRGASANRAPSDTTSTERSERTVPSLRSAARSVRAGSGVDTADAGERRGSERARARAADQSAARNRPRIHTVKPGESLWQIASDQVGDGATNAAIARMVKRLAVRNAGRIDDSGRLEIGQRLRLARPQTARTSRERSASSDPNRRLDSRTAPRSKERDRAKQRREVREADDRGVRDQARIYTVKPGESLWKIAERLLGQDATGAGVARRVKHLSSINSGRFNDPDLLRTGQKLRLR